MKVNEFKDYLVLSSLGCLVYVVGDLAGLTAAVLVWLSGVFWLVKTMDQEDA